MDVNDQDGNPPVGVSHEGSWRGSLAPQVMRKKVARGTEHGPS
jgi:hypothetical protein